MNLVNAQFENNAHAFNLVAFVWFVLPCKQDVYILCGYIKKCIYSNAEVQISGYGAIFV